MIIQIFLWWLFIWINSFLLHELMHILEANRQSKPQTENRGDIQIWKWSMSASANYNNQNRFLLAGGLYTSVVLITLAFITDYPPVHVPLIMWGVSQLIYGFYEMKYYHKLSFKQFRIGRYSIYLAGNILVFIMYYLLGVITFP